MCLLYITYKPSLHGLKICYMYLLLTAHTTYTHMHGIFCYMPTDNCNDGDIRLVNGKSDMEGRLELCRGRRWGTVCDFSVDRQPHSSSL